MMHYPARRARRACISTCVAVVALLGACTDGSAPQAAAAETEPNLVSDSASIRSASIDSLRALDAQLQDAVARKDLERIVSFYADDATMLPTAEPLIRGKQAIREEWAHILAIPGFTNQGKLLSVDVSASNDFAYTTGSYMAVMVGENGAMVNEPGKWVSIWKRQAGGPWRIVVDTYNTDIPPPDHK
jgi:uncharacterized protein (TIGR02246 family)